MFNKPTAITIGIDGTAYVWDSGNSRIRRITSKGNVFSLPAGQFSSVSDLATLPTGEIVVAGSGRIRGIRSSGEIFDIAGGFSDNLSIAVDWAGNIFVADFFNHRIRRISPDRNVSTIAGSGNIGSVGGEGIFSSFEFPDGIAVNSLGGIVVHQQGGSVTRTISPTGVVSGSTIPSPSEPRIPRFLAFDEFDILYQGTVSAAHQIVGRNFKGEEVIAFAVEERVGDIAADRNGHIFATDSDAHKLFRISLNYRAILLP